MTSIRVTLPEDGRKLCFAREIQNDPDGDLRVEFKVGGGRFFSLLSNTALAALLFLGFCLVLKKR